MPSCNGVCHRTAVPAGNGLKYATGKKRCSQCEKYFITDYAFKFWIL